MNEALPAVLPPTGATASNVSVKVHQHLTGASQSQAADYLQERVESILKETFTAQEDNRSSSKLTLDVYVLVANEGSAL